MTNERDEAIIEAVMRLIDRQGLAGLSRYVIAKEAGISPASVSNFGLSSMSRLRPRTADFRGRIMKAIAERGVATGDAQMIRIGQIEGYL